MANGSESTIDVAGVKRRVSILPDFPDLRDRVYEPSLLEIKKEILPDQARLIVRDQGVDGSCVGFALAAVLNLQLQKRGELKDPYGVSPLMLFQMAKQHDEWEGTDYNYSSPRGALKGFFHNGVCMEREAPYDGENDLTQIWAPNLDAARSATNITLGAYYRLRPNLVDYHCALNETGALLVSLQSHRGWQNPKHHDVIGKIKFSRAREGGHAVAIIGYNREGFIIQNSWGENWGRYKGMGGVALLTYKDWAENIIDAWTLRLGVSSRDVFQNVHALRQNHPAIRKDKSNEVSISLLARRPSRKQIKGHYIHIDDSKLVTSGTYPTNAEELSYTADLLRVNRKKYKHLLVYIHGGLISAPECARQIMRVKEIYKNKGVYSIHIMWETSLTNQFWDILKATSAKSHSRIGSAFDFSDSLIEKFARRAGGRAIWQSMKLSAQRAFHPSSIFPNVLEELIKNAQLGGMKIHFAAHSAGAIFLANILESWPQYMPKKTIAETVTLWAPACKTDDLNSSYKNALTKQHIGKIEQINLNETHELDDDCKGIYHKSLLELVSRAFEDELNTPLAGLTKHSKQIFLKNNYTLHITGQKSCPSSAHRHTDFKRDPDTQNHLLTTILGHKIDGRSGFTERDLL